MKIKCFQVTIKPCQYPAIEADFRDLTVEVIADGRMMTTSHTIRNSDFEDTLGSMMREAERLIRGSVREAEVLREADKSIESSVKKSP